MKRLVILLAAAALFASPVSAQTPPNNASVMVPNGGGSGGATQTTGSWTPTDASGASLVFTAVSASYTQIGNMVFAYASFQYPSTASGANALIGGLPVTVANQNYARQCAMTNAGIASAVNLLPGKNPPQIPPVTQASANITNATLSLAIDSNASTRHPDVVAGILR
jgi:hypothetical protein